MPYFNVCFARPRSNRTEQTLRVKAESKELAIEAYKRRAKDLPEVCNFFTRPISEQWRKKEQVARRLRKVAEGMGYELNRIFDSEEWEVMSPNCSDRDYLELAMCSDFTIIQFVKDFERLQFHFYWDNLPSECLADHSDKPDADTLAKATITHFEGRKGY